MTGYFIKVNGEFIKINKEDIDEIVNPLIFSILKKKRAQYENVDQYSYIGQQLKNKCNNIGFVLYNYNKKKRNINNYLNIEYSGVKKYIEMLGKLKCE